MSELKPGEFRSEGVVFHAISVRADGPLTKDCLYGTHQIRHVVPIDPDFPAALAALQALYEEQEKVEWVEITSVTRIQENGEDPQWRDFGSDLWKPAMPGSAWVLAFRKGLGVGKSCGF